MSPKTAFAAILVLLSLSALADTRTLVSPELHSKGATISGVVQRVDGNLIRLADGLITVDASEAKILIDRGREGTAADIEPGMQLFATIGSNGKASTISATRAGDATIFGAVDSVDVAAKTLVILGYTIHVDANTSFGGFRKGEDVDLSDIMTNQLVQVQVDAVNGSLVAREVLILAPLPPQAGHVRGTVKSIGTESWEIKIDREVVTVLVNAQTKIAGSPKVGDTVEVLYTIDSANNKVAISILKFEVSTPPRVVQFHGKVKSITGPTWVVTVDGSNEEKTFTVNERTKVTGAPVVGDLVQVLATQADDGKLTAIAVMKLRF